MDWSSVVALGHWLQNTRYALAIAESSWAYPIVQATHFSGISLWLGTNFAVDVSLLGFGNKRQTPAQLSDTLFFWNWLGFGIALLGGFLLFSVSSAWPRQPVRRRPIVFFRWAYPSLFVNDR